MPEHGSPILLTYAVKDRSSLRWQHRLDRLIAVLWVAAATAFAWAAGRELVYHVSAVSWTSMWESAPLEVAMHAVRGEPVYGNWHEGPVHLAIYGPLYYKTLGVLGTAAHADPQAMIPLARWWGIFCLAAGLAGVVWFIRAGGGPWWAAVIGIGCTGLLTPTALRFIASARPDAMAAALSCLGLTAALGRRRFGPVLGAVLLSMAWLTKVTAVAAIFTLAVALVWQRNWRQLAWVAGLYALLNCLVVVGLLLATDGWFLKHLNVASAAPSHVKYVWFMLSRRPYEAQLPYLFVFPALALLTLAWVRFRGWHENADTAHGQQQALTRKPASPPDDPPAHTAQAASSDARPPTALQISGLFFVLSALIALATALRQGSDRNYLIEPTLAVGMVMGTWAARVAGWQDRRAWLWTRGAACIALFSPLLLNLSDRFASSTASDRIQRDVLSPYQDDALEWVRSLPQPLLCLDSWLAYKAVVPNDINDPIAYSSYALGGGPDPIARRVEKGYYRCIITTAPVDAPGAKLYGDIETDWPALRDAIGARYRLVPSPGWCAYAPIGGH